MEDNVIDADAVADHVLDPVGVPVPDRLDEPESVACVELVELTLGERDPEGEADTDADFVPVVLALL